MLTGSKRPEKLLSRFQEASLRFGRGRLGGFCIAMILVFRAHLDGRETTGFSAGLDSLNL